MKVNLDSKFAKTSERSGEKFIEIGDKPSAKEVENAWNQKEGQEESSAFDEEDDVKPPNTITSSDDFSSLQEESKYSEFTLNTYTNTSKERGYSESSDSVEEQKIIQDDSEEEAKGEDEEEKLKVKFDLLNKKILIPFF